MIFGGPVPLVIGLVGVVGGLFGRWRDETRDPFGWRLPLTIGVAFLASFLGINGLPDSSLDVASMTILAMAILGTFSQASRRTILCATVAIIVMGAMIQWDLRRQDWWLRVAPIAYGAILFVILEGVSRRMRP
ncbi:MAG: hypothetical protein KDA28_11335, partial [Phycisphaerales bacterium]|nr:hypothetical protein [Phycisphaerales bacterium]